MSSLVALVKTLQNENMEQTTQAYSKMNTALRKNSTTECSSQVWLDLASSLKRDLTSNNEDVADAAIQALSTTVSHKNIIDVKNINDALLPCLSEFPYSTATSDAMKASLSSIFKTTPVPTLLQILHESITKDTKNRVSIEVKNETLTFISNLISDKENKKTDVEGVYAKIIQILLTLTTDDNELIRKNSLDSAQVLISAYPVQLSHIALVASCLKISVLPKIKSVYCKNAGCLCEILTHQWPLYLKIMGMNIRKSSSLINALLAVVEQGFRHSQVDVKTASFKAWDCLINCFAEDLEVLSSPRYMKLLMQPLTTMQSCDELNVTRMETLWGLADKLGSKLPMLFTMVCVPILHCCLGSLDPDKRSKKSMDSAAASSIKARRSSSHVDGFHAALQATGYRATPKNASNSPRLQTIGVEVLIHLLQSSENDTPDLVRNFTTPPLSTTFLSVPATFTSNGQLFISAVSEVLCYMSSLSDDTVLLLWERLHHHVRLHLEMNLKKKKREPELFNSFLFTLQSIINAESRSNSTVFQMVESFFNFPIGILSSTFYGGSLNSVHGVPALCLLRLLFSKRLVSNLSSSNVDRITSTAEKFVLCGFDNNIRILAFSQSVIESLGAFIDLARSQASLNNIEIQSHLKLATSLWSKLGKELNDHILKSQEVNQGDSLDHDFTVLYSFLLFPLRRNLPFNSCLDTWKQVYKSFLWGCDFVTTCKPNEVCDHIVSSLLKMDIDTWSESNIYFTANICFSLVGAAEYNHDGFDKPGKYFSYDEALSPVEKSTPGIKLDKHKNLSKLCVLLHHLFKIMQEKVDADLCELLMKTLHHIFTSIRHEDDVSSLFSFFLSRLNDLVLFQHNDSKTFAQQLESILRESSKVFSNEQSVRQLLQNENFIEFLRNCIKLSDRKIRNAAAEFWHTVVVSSSQHSSLCDYLSAEFRSLIFPVYKQMGWACPWKDIELPNSLDLPDAETSQTDTQTHLAPPGYGAFGSPLKKHSFLSPKKSPARASPVKTPVKSPFGAKRKLNSLTDDVVYVKCSSPFSKPKTPLTEHQKEKLCEREFIPTMYNDLDEKQEQEMDTQTQDMEGSKGDEENSNDSEIKNDDVIQSSQDVELETKKKVAHKPARKKISLKKIATILEEETTPLRRSGRNMKKQCSDQRNDKSTISNNKEEIASVDSSAESERDSLTGEMSEAAMDVSNDTDKDASYEYVEIHDMSTNQTKNEISVDDDSDNEDEGKDLGVTPLDESYECVEVHDMSANVTLGVRCDSNVSGDDLINSPHSAEQESAAVADISTVQDNSGDKENPGGESETEPRRSLRKRKPSSRVSDMMQYISSDEEERPTESHGLDPDKSLNTTEYEYVQVCDTSVAPESNQTIDEDDHKEELMDRDVEDHENNEDNDSVYEDSRSDDNSNCAGLITEDETEPEDDFLDARESLGAESVRSNGSKAEDVIDVSGESSASGDIFETSAEKESDNSLAQESIISIGDASESEVDENTEAKTMASTGTTDTIGLTSEGEKQDESTLRDDNIEPRGTSESEKAGISDSSESSKLPRPQMTLKVPVVMAIQADSILPPGQSPSARGILKRRSSICTDLLPMQSPGNKRRVSFAEPISKSKRMEVVNEEFQQSPRSSLMHRKKFSPKVNRRLSLQPEKKSGEIGESPLSLRSAKVAEAIANIRAKDANSPSSFSKADFKDRREDNLDLKNIKLKDIQDPDYLKLLTKSQLGDLACLLANSIPVIVNAMSQKNCEP